MRRTILVSLCAFLVGAIFSNQSGQVSGSSAINERTPIPQPSNWVAFTAKLDVITPSRVPLSGRFVRGDTGATRVELADGKGWSSVEITSPLEQTYIRGVKVNDAEKWLGGRLDSPIDMTRPRPFTTGIEGISLYPRKLAILEGQSGSLESEDGLEAWLYTTKAGSMRLLAPALNFALIVDVSVRGRRWEMSVIRIGPVGPAEFDVPPNVVVDWSGPLNKGVGTHQPGNPDQ